MAYLPLGERPAMAATRRNFFTDLITRMFAAVRNFTEAARRVKACEEMLGLDDDRLRDLGLTRNDVERALRDPSVPMSVSLEGARRRNGWSL